MNVIDFLRITSWLTWLFCVEESRTQGVKRKVAIVQAFQTLKCLLDIFPQGIEIEHFKKASPHWNLSRDFEKPMTHISHVFFICEKGTWTNWTNNWITLCWLHDLFHCFRIHPRKRRNGGPQNDGPWILGALLYWKNMAIFSYQFLRLLGCIIHDVSLYFHDGRQVHSLGCLKQRQPPWVPWSWHISVWNILKKLWRTPTPNGVLNVGHVGWLVFADPKNEQTLWGDVCVRWTWGEPKMMSSCSIWYQMLAQIFFVFVFLGWYPNVRKLTLHPENGWDWNLGILVLLVAFWGLAYFQRLCSGQGPIILEEGGSGP